MPNNLDEEMATRAQESLAKIRAAIGRVYVGPQEPIELMLIALMARGHALLEGVPGVAKTTLVKALASVLGCQMGRIQFTPDLLPQDLTGSYVLNPKEGTFKLRAGPIFANVVLADEINRAPAKTQSALLEAMQERQVTIEGERFELPDPFLVLATQNPIDLEGTYPLPEAQIDRFVVRIPIGYPGESEEIAMLRTHAVVSPKLQPLLNQASCQALQSAADGVHVEEDLLEYAARLSRFTRGHRHVALGCSPRATLALLRAAKAAAILVGRVFLTPDDIRRVAPYTLGHRLVLNPELEGNQRARDDVIADAMTQVPYRREVRAK